MSRDGLRVRVVTDDEGYRLLRIVRRSSGSVVTWRRAQMVLLSVQGMDVAAIAKVTFTSADRVREVINNFNDDGFDSLYPKYAADRRSSRCPSARRSRRSPCRDPEITGCGSRRGACPSWPSSSSLRGWSTTSAMKAFGSCSARRRCPFKP